MKFTDKLAAAIRANDSLLCVGLDPDIQRFPDALQGKSDAIFTFCKAIIDATAATACAFKPQIAYFAALAAEDQLQAICDYLKTQYPQIPIVLDAKRGDIGNTASAYAQSAFGHFNADAITLNPYMGGDTLEPFLRHADRGGFLLCRTSNPGSRDIQELILADGRPLYLAIAELAANHWNTNQNVGLVVGATQPDALKAVRTICPELPFLLPGIGAQGGDLVQALNAGLDARRSGLLINVSRSVMYASSGTDYAQAARIEAIRTRDAINAVRHSA